jgi:hypothetical protein
VAETEEIEHVEHLPGSLWQRLRAEPERAPEIIALAAAERFGPRAERWVAVAGPGHEPAALAQTAVKKHVRIARAEGAAFGIGGVATTAADLVALTWLQSRMVFYVAAAMGYDPRHPMRPAELLALQGVYQTPQAAREGLDGVGQSMAAALVSAKLEKGRDEAIAARLVKYATKRMAKRYAGRLVPLIGAPIGAIQNAGATKDLGRRTLEFYGAA